MEKVKKLTISEIFEARSLLLQLLESGNSLDVDLSGLEDIDISGLQLLVSFAKEVSILKKNVNFKGIFTETFRDSLIEVAYLSEAITNGEDFSLYIEEIIRSN